jgi:phospho-N-acetylmuramoyl-pentapeptide-transferase
MELMKNGILVSILPCLLAFVVTAVLGPVFIPWLHKLKFGQEIREEGPSWHQKKSGTPTIGGIMFIVGIGVAVSINLVLMAIKGNADILAWKGLLMFVIALGFGVIGFVDDYIKVVKKRNLGLTAIQKFLLQMLLTVVYILVLKQTGELQTTIIIPFTSLSWTMPLWLYIPFVLIAVTATVNAVNLTDGLDGLATTVTVIVALFFFTTAALLQQSGSMSLAASVVGALLGFLIYNKYPARVFMGDTGSLFLGGVIVVMAVGMKMPLFILIAGFIYFLEALSVILQVASFKLTGKRIFKMSPIHHHFEMCGWSEKKIVAVFGSVTFVLCLLGLAGFLVWYL